MCTCNKNCGCNTTPCPPITCTCPILLNSDCTNNFTEDLPYANILKGQTLTEVVVLFDAYVNERFGSVTNFFELINVGAGSQIYKGVSILGKKEIRTLVDSGLINLVTGTDTVTISVDEAALNTFIEANQKTNTVANVGTGAEVYKNSTTTGDNTQFNLRKIKSTDNSVTVTQGTDDIDLSIEITATPPLEKIDEGNGDGIIVRGRTAANYGNVGSNAVDLSFSSGASITKGATGESSFASGEDTTASEIYAHAEGVLTVSSGVAAHAEGSESRALGFAAHAEGGDTEASGEYSHSEGLNTTASGDQSHAEGINTTASGLSTHAEGGYSQAIGDYSHAGGFGSAAHAYGSAANGVESVTRAYGEFSAGHYGTDVAGSATTIVTTDRLFNIGNGTSAISTSDALTVLKNGLATLPSVTNALITAGSNKSIVTKEYLASVNDGSETKVIAGTNASVTGTGTIASPYVVSSTYVAPTPDGSETKVTAGTNITVTGTGTVASPYVVSSVDLSSITAYLPVNRGYCYTLDVEATTGSLSVGGDITAATVASTSNSSVITVTMANAMANTNYKVATVFQTQAADVTAAIRVFAPLFKPISTTQFYAVIEENAAIAQNLRIHFDVFQL